MGPIEVSTELEADVRTVWDDIARLETHPEWMSDAATLEFRGDRRSGIGTVIEVTTRIGPFVTRDVLHFTSWEPPRRMGVDHRGLFTGKGEFRIDPSPAGSTFTWSEQVRFPWWIGGPVGAWLARPILRRVWRRNLRRLAGRFSGP